MIRTSRIGLAALIALTFLPAAASAREPLRLSIDTRVDGVSALRVSASRSGIERKSLDYGVFAAELLAFVLKEVLSDSPDEYAGALIPARLSNSMPETSSAFESHCLEFVARVGSAVTGVEGGDPGAFDSRLMGIASSVVVIGKTLSIVGEDEDGGDTLSLRPDVGTNKFGMAFTVRW